MTGIVLILCSTFLILVIIFWIIPTIKLREIVKAIISLLKALPVIKIIEGIIEGIKRKDKNKKDKKDKYNYPD